MKCACGLLPLLLALLLAPGACHAQQIKQYRKLEGPKKMEPHRLHWGGSVGTGGVHFIFTPSFDLHWRMLSLRLAPDPWYLSASFTSRVGYYRRHVRTDRPMLLSFAYHNDVFLAEKSPEPGVKTRKDRQIFMGMWGIHADLDHLGRVYFEGLVGGMLIWDQFHPLNGQVPNDRFFPLPVVEFRVGAIYQSHKWRYPPTEKTGIPRTNYYDVRFIDKLRFFRQR